MIGTSFGEFELVKNYRDAFILDDFNQKYVDALNIYPYIVGDYSAGMLRLKGFSENNKANSFKLIPDYLAESCPMNCAYFILKNPNFDPNLKRDE